MLEGFDAELLRLQNGLTSFSWAVTSQKQKDKKSFNVRRLCRH